MSKLIKNNIAKKEENKMEFSKSLLQISSFLDKFITGI
jgi:hypothetical protein